MAQPLLWWHYFQIMILHRHTGPTWTLPSIAFNNLKWPVHYLGNVSHKTWLISVSVETETLLFLNFVCPGLYRLINGVYLCVASETDNYTGLMWNCGPLCFSEIFLYCENCLLLKASVCVWVWETEWVRNRDTSGHICFKLDEQRKHDGVRWSLYSEVLFRARETVI